MIQFGLEIDGTKLVCYTGNETEVLVPNIIKIIGERAFKKKYKKDYSPAEHRNRRECF